MTAQSFKMAIKSILSNKMRSFLTMLGIIIGVCSLVVLVSFVRGAASSITDSINSIGSNFISITVSDDKNKPIKMDDLTRLAEETELIDNAAPTAQANMTASGNSSEENIKITGTTTAYKDIQGLGLSIGRFLKKPDIDNHSNVAVISSDAAEDIMGRKNAVGESIKLNGRSYKIIGVLTEEKSGNVEKGSDYRAYIPYTSLIRMSDNIGLDITSFCISASGDNTDAAEKYINKWLLDRFEQDEDAYSIINQSAVADAMSSVNDTLSILLGGIAGISLLVGGIGIMNIMLVSVTERTGEIGIRKAIGAGRSSIMLQFLIEALVVSLMGCILGIIMSWLILHIVGFISGTSYKMSLSAVTVSVIFSVVIGVIFGIYPANKAANMKPIDALRFQ